MHTFLNIENRTVPIDANAIYESNVVSYTGNLLAHGHSTTLSSEADAHFTNGECERYH